MGSDDSLISAIQPLSIVDAVARDLRDKLFSGRLNSSEQLTEARVATAYNVARPTAKAAIEKLVAEGLLVRGAHKTARVPEMDADDVRDLYFSRGVIESGVVKRLAMTRTVPPSVVSSNKQIVRVGSESAIEPTVNFHVELVAALGSPRINRLFAALMGDMRLCMVQMQSRRILRVTPIAKEHDRIIAEIAAGRPDAAVEAMVDHLNLACDRLVLVLEGEVPEQTRR